MQKSFIILLGITSFLFGCGSSGSQDEEQSQQKDQQNNQTSEINKDLLKGEIKLQVDGKPYEITSFDKRRSEITWMDENKIVLRITSIDKEKSISLLLSGPNAYGATPLSITLDASKYEEVDHGSLNFQGLLGSKDNISTTMLLSGTGKITELDQETLDFAMSFEGTAIHNELQTKSDTVAIEGSIAIQFDNAVDTRKN